MATDLFMIAYCSRNRVAGGEATLEPELTRILATARRNNERAGVTGMLLYNAGSFAQVLEGPLSAIERTFETIQQDPRHGDVMLLHSGSIEERSFGEWSMAYAGAESLQEVPGAGEAMEALRAGANNAEQMLVLLRQLVIEEGVWAAVDSAALEPVL